MPFSPTYLFILEGIAAVEKFGIDGEGNDERAEKRVLDRMETEDPVPFEFGEKHHHKKEYDRKDDYPAAQGNGLIAHADQDHQINECGGQLKGSQQHLTHRHQNQQQGEKAGETRHFHIDAVHEKLPAEDNQKQKQQQQTEGAQSACSILSRSVTRAKAHRR